MQEKKGDKKKYKKEFGCKKKQKNETSAGGRHG